MTTSEEDDNTDRFSGNKLLSLHCIIILNTVSWSVKTEKNISEIKFQIVLCFRSQAQRKRQILLPEMDGRSGTILILSFHSNQFDQTNYLKQD